MKNFVYQAKARNYYYYGGENGGKLKEGKTRDFHHSKGIKCYIFMITGGEKLQNRDNMKIFKIWNIFLRNFSTTISGKWKSFCKHFRRSGVKILNAHSEASMNQKQANWQREEEEEDTKIK